jgi:hypothetical protein
MRKQVTNMATPEMKRAGRSGWSVLQVSVVLFAGAGVAYLAYNILARLGY